MRGSGCLVKAACAVAAWLSSFAPVGPAAASDGVLEINQACATTGCFPGDTAGFPVSIAVGGSYRLTSNLVVNGGTAIAVSTTESTELDLNGFAIRGPGGCSGQGGGVACTGLAGVGVHLVTSGDQFQIRLHDGAISGFQEAIRSPDITVTGVLRISDVLIESSGTGVFSPFAGSPISRVIIERSTVRRMSGSCVFLHQGVVEVLESRLIDCHDSGVFNSGKLVVSDSRIERVGVSGLSSGDDTVVRDVEVRDFGGTGINCGRTCMVSKTLISRGRGRGIQASFISTIVDNVVDFNGDVSIFAGDGSTIRGNSVGAASDLGTFPGIICGTGCNVLDNVVRNSSQPLNLDAHSSYRRNVLSLYPGAPVIGSGVSGGDNLCNGTSC